MLGRSGTLRPTEDATPNGDATANGGMKNIFLDGSM
jgi:hypothetical protein